MTIEDKITHIQEAAMTEARAEGNKIIASHRGTLESLQDRHAEEARRQTETRIKSEVIRSKQQLNQATAKAQVELKRALGKRQIQLKDQLFAEVRELITQYMATDQYLDLLQSYVNHAAAFAGGEPLTIYLNSTDTDKKEELEKRTGLSLSVGGDNFIGGLRAAIPGRNILIDHSFKSKLESEYEKFQFLGGGSVE